MIQPGNHIDDLILSAAVDDQLTPEEARAAKAHLEACDVCRARLDDLRAVVSLLGDLPTLEVPRDFSLGLRLVADPPNVIRLRRWYSVARVGAASLAAAFVFLSAGALYVGSQPGTSTGSLAAGSQFASAPAPTAPEIGTAAKSAPASAPAAARPAPAVAPPPAAQAAPGAAGQSAAPAAAASVQAAPPPAAAAAARSQAAPGAPGPDAADQVTAATSVRPLPTPVPTLAPIPTRAPPQVAAQPAPAARADSAAPLRIAAASAGVLALAGLLAALIIRHRLRTAIPRTE